jgi:hypothetical protein
MFAGNFCQWFKNKAPLCETWVRDGEFFTGECVVVVKENVEVKGARAPAFNAYSVSIGFDL